MGNIVLLDDLTINKIAAGEVIERPASVIKEMIENSIDAGATSITVEIKNGGISYIRVTDNGKGIPEDDLEIAFERHATSKIRSADDLTKVMSMGFRGEALASIAAIAKVEMVSKTEAQPNGYKIIVEGGKTIGKTEIGCSNGTSITVTNLFYNTPVRYKFLRKDFTEAGYIEDAIARIALIHPEVAIKLINTGKTVIQTNGNGDLKTVIYSIYGKDVAENILETDYTYEDIRISGVIGKPEIARSNRANQLFFVNKRYIKDKTLSSATEKAYKGLIPIGKFSFLVLNIEMNPSKVDVNVHPAKLEVRFEDENIIFKAIYHAIKETLQKNNLTENSIKSATNPFEKLETPIASIMQIPNTKLESIEKLEETKSESKNINIAKIPNINNNETIIEQIFRQRQEKSNIDKKENYQIENNKEEFQKSAENSEKEKIQQNLQENRIEETTLEKSQEILRQLQEMKEKMLQENKIKTDVTNNIENTEQMQQNKQISENKNEIKYDTKENEDEGITAKEGEEKYKLQYDKTEEIKPNNEEPKEEIKYQEQKEITKIETENEIKQEKVEEQKTQDFDQMYQKMFGTKPLSIETKEEKTENQMEDIVTLGNTSIFDKIEEYQKINYKLVGITFETFIILEIEKEMYIVDQHSANEKILYEKIKRNYYNNNVKDSQLLLLPDIITLSHKEMAIAKDNLTMFRKAGFMLEEFGENTIKLSGVPEMCIDLETDKMFVEILNEINSVARTEKQEIEEKFIWTIANKVAEKFKIAETREEVENLIDNLLITQDPFTGEQGKPIAIKMSKYDIERKFARK